MFASSYDAIVIGAGHNGLTLAIKLQRAGLSTLIVEAADKVGGMSRTDEPVLPGFRHDPHANLLSFYDLMPMAEEFQLEANGLRTVSPEAQHGICFSDGRPPLILHRPDLRSRTLASIARYSARDAETYRALAARVDTLGPLLRDGLYAPARAEWFRRQADVLNAIGQSFGLGRTFGSRSARAVIDDLFETPELRALLYQLVAEFGGRLEEPGGDLGFVGQVLWMVGRWRLPLGGMQAVPDALNRVAQDEGVHVALGVRISKIEVANGRVQGIVAAGLGKISARCLVASSVGPVATLLEFVGTKVVGSSTTEELRSLASAPASTLASLMFCLREPPAYSSGRWDPEINHCLRTVVGFDSPEGVAAHLRSIDLGCLPTPAAAVRVSSLWDASRAPKGGHVASLDALMPDPHSFAYDEWQVVQESYAEAFLERWSEYAPNITRKSVIAEHIHLAGDYERKLWFREGPDQYRTAIRHLYLCGASTYPGGGVHGACGHNAYRVIRDDLKL